MQEWQKGIDIESLRAFAEPFKRRQKPLVFGAFGLIKERDIAEYLASKRAVWTGSPPQAVALFSIAKAASEQQDFAQRRLAIPKGAVIIRGFAALDIESGGLWPVVLRVDGPA